MAETKRIVRPLSPHVQIFRWHLPMVTSILTRITGNGLIAGTLLIVWWWLAAATGPEAYARADWVVKSWFGKLVLTASLWALWYHYLAGIRHLIFDAGRGLDIPTAEKLGWAIIAGSFLLTALTFLFI